MVKNNTLYNLAFFLFFIACQTGSLDPIEYIKWVENKDNGLKQQKVIGEIEFTLQYRPIEYVIALEEKKEKLKAGTLSERKKEFSGLQYYMLRYSLVKKGSDIMKYNISNDADYYTRMNYFSFGLQDDIVLVDQGDTLKCKLFNSIRSYGASPFADFVLAFEDKGNVGASDKELIIDEKAFDTGQLRFRIDKKDIEKTPQLKTY